MSPKITIWLTQILGSECGVFVAMNGLVLRPNEATRSDVGQFMQKLWEVAWWEENLFRTEEKIPTPKYFCYGSIL